MNRWVISIFLGTILLSGSWARAEEEIKAIHPGLEDRFTVSAGAFWGFLDSSATFDLRDVGEIVSVDFEDDLGLDESQLSPWVYARLRFLRRFRLEFEYTGTDRDNTQTFRQTVVGIPIETGIKGTFETDFYRLALGYSFLKGQDHELGVSVGASIVKVKAGLEVTGQLGPFEDRISEQEDVTGPLPMIALYGAYAFTPKLLLEARGGYFKANVGDYDGSITEAFVGIQYRPFENFGFGLGYNFLRPDIDDVSNSSFIVKYKYQQQGPVLFATVGF